MQRIKRRSSVTQTGQPAALKRRGANIFTDTITQHSGTHTTSRVQAYPLTCSNLQKFPTC